VGQLITHVVRLLNQGHSSCVVTLLVKVKAHCWELLYEAANALTSAAAEMDASLMTGDLH
jgi:hypothetical protein